MKRISLLSPAKLNLFLRVVDKRPDGYHNLLTLFERIDLCDELRFVLNKSGDIRIFCDHPGVPAGPENLVYKTAELLKNDFALQDGVDVTIRKRIPVAAGLGGGSSNAATALLGLNRLWKLSLTKKQFLSYARTIGSDVPFFLYDCSWALGRERGDRVRKLSLNTKLWHILIVPTIPMYSREVFRGVNLRLTKKKDDVNILIRALRKNDLEKAGHFLLNDLETRILELAPDLGRLKTKLLDFKPQGIAFSGSGPSLYGITRSRKEAEEIQSAFQRREHEVFVVRTF